MKPNAVRAKFNSAQRAYFLVVPELDSVVSVVSVDGVQSVPCGVPVPEIGGRFDIITLAKIHLNLIKIVVIDIITQQSLE